MSFRLNSFIHESLLVFSSVQVEAGVGEVVRPPTDVGCSLLPGAVQGQLFLGWTGSGQGLPGPWAQHQHFLPCCKAAVHAGRGVIPHVVPPSMEPLVFSPG